MTRLMTLGLLTTLAGIALSGDDIPWSYSGESGPEYWGELSPEYRLCSEGRNQSPIDLTQLTEAELNPISLDYQRASAYIHHNGHTVKVNVQPGSQLRVNGRVFELKEFHAHAPSENLVGGQSFPMELHLVHADQEGHLAVVGVLFSEGEINPTLAKAWATLPQKDDKFTVVEPFSPAGLLPANRDHYLFNGSLTTPPCAEGVLWMVMKEPVTASPNQINAFKALMHHPNNRPVQPINARPVLQ